MNSFPKYRVFQILCGVVLATLGWLLISGSPSDTEARLTPTPEAESDLPMLLLPAELTRAREIMDVEVVGYDVQNLTLTLSNVKQAVRVRVPLGARATAIDKEDMSPQLVTADTEVTTSPGRSARVQLPVVNVDIKRAGTPRSKTRFELSAPDESSQRVRFLGLAAGKKDASWGFRQVGVWILVDNVSRRDIGRIHLWHTNTGLGMGSPSFEVSIGSDKVYTELEQTFAAMGLDTSTYVLFQERRKDFELALKTLDPTNPARNASNYLRAGTLRKYNSPELEKRFLAFAGDANRPELRDRAVRALLDEPMTAPPESLWQTALGDGPRTLRLLAAWALTQRGDPRALPLAVVLGRDPGLPKALGHRLEQAVKDRGKLHRRREELLLAYWERTVGWDALSEADEVRTAVEALGKVEANETILTECLARLGSGDAETVRAAVGRLARYCSDRREAFDAVSRLALTATDDRTRRDARWKLASFNGFDVGGVWARALASETDVAGATSVLYAANNAKGLDRGPLFEKGLNHAQPGVRRIAATLLAPGTHPRADEVLARRGLVETDRKVFSAIVNRLKRNKSARYATVLARGVTLGRPYDRIRSAETILGEAGAAAADRATAVKLLTDYAAGRVKATSQYQSAAMFALCRTDPKSAWPIVSEILIYKKGTLRRQAWLAMTRTWKGTPEATQMARRLKLDGEFGDRADAYLKQQAADPATLLQEDAR